MYTFSSRDWSDVVRITFKYEVGNVVDKVFFVKHQSQSNDFSISGRRIAVRNKSVVPAILKYSLSKANS